MTNSTVSFDATALLALQIESSPRTVALRALERGSVWCASELALGEAVAAAHRLTGDSTVGGSIEDDIRRLWDHFHVVPVDRRILDESAELASTQPVSFSTAIHLVSARRLGIGNVFVTFDPAQIPVALSLGLEVVSG